MNVNLVNQTKIIADVPQILNPAKHHPIYDMQRETVIIILGINVPLCHCSYIHPILTDFYNYFTAILWQQYMYSYYVLIRPSVCLYVLYKLLT